MTQLDQATLQQLYEQGLLSQETYQNLLHTQPVTPPVTWAPFINWSGQPPSLNLVLDPETAAALAAPAPQPAAEPIQLFGNPATPLNPTGGPLRRSTQDQRDAVAAAVAAIRTNGVTIQAPRRVPGAEEQRTWRDLRGEFYNERLGVPHAMVQERPKPKFVPVTCVLVLPGLTGTAEHPVDQLRVIEGLLHLVLRTGNPDQIYLPYTDWVFNFVQSAFTAVAQAAINGGVRKRIGRSVTLFDAPTSRTYPWSELDCALITNVTPLVQKQLNAPSTVEATRIFLLGGGVTHEDRQQKLAESSYWKRSLTVAFPSTGGFAAKCARSNKADVVWNHSEPTDRDWETRFLYILDGHEAATAVRHGAALAAYDLQPDGGKIQAANFTPPPPVTGFQRGQGWSGGRHPWLEQQPERLGTPYIEHPVSMVTPSQTHRQFLDSLTGANNGESPGSP